MTAAPKISENRDFRPGVLDLLAHTGHVLRFSILRSDNALVTTIGFSDIVAIHPMSGDVIVVELKGPDTVLPHAEKVWLHGWARAGVDAIVVRPADMDTLTARLLAGRTSRQAWLPEHRFPRHMTPYIDQDGTIPPLPVTEALRATTPRPKGRR